MITNMPPEKLIELERAHGYWIGWVDGALFQFTKILKRSYRF